MSKHDQVVNFFRQVPIGSFVTRKMFMDTMKAEGLYETDLDNIRCKLQRAGYIYDGDKKIAGVYFMARAIPKELNSTKLNRLAYPKKQKFNYNLVHYELSPDLQDITGLKIATSSETFKAFWEYVRKHQLQSSNPRVIRVSADPQLRSIFPGLARVHLFEMMRYLRKHMTNIGFKQAKSYE